MDPHACLLRARRALVRGDIEEMYAAITDYFDWRRRGGFEPTMNQDRGDAFALSLQLQARALEIR